MLRFAARAVAAIHAAGKPKCSPFGRIPLGPQYLASAKRRFASKLKKWVSSSSTNGAKVQQTHGHPPPAANSSMATDASAVHKSTVDFGKHVFCANKMQKALSVDEFKDWEKAVAENWPMKPATGDAIARAVRDWAVSHGATHYTHWFQPLTGKTAEVHQAFLDIQETGGFGPSARFHPTLSFGREQLFHAEADGSSFPTGGLRSTFAARALTSWDPSSPPFLLFSSPAPLHTGSKPKPCTLYLPAVFYSHAEAEDDGGLREAQMQAVPQEKHGKTGLGPCETRKTVALDNKIPLLRSIRALSGATRRFLSTIHQEGCLGQGVAQHAGIEQEFFLVNRQMFLKRPDLRMTGRVLLGQPQWRHQQFSDNYFGSMSERALAFHHELETTCWSLGIALKIRHREVCPGQYEVAPCFAHASTAIDQNMLLSVLLPRIALRHGLAVLLHDKPFPNVNGSGKHNNWSFGTQHVPSLLNAKFLNATASVSEQLRTALLFTAFFKAVDEHGALLRLSICGAGNDHRLGGFEAPPSVISVCVGQHISDRLLEIFGLPTTEHKSCGGEEDTVRQKLLTVLASHALQYRERRQQSIAGASERVSFSSTDRNRTSPIAFNGNKFEFRAVGASQNPSISTLFLNAAMAKALAEMSDAIKEYHSHAVGTPIEECARRVGAHMLQRHQRIVFNGNGYAKDWLVESKRRGLAHFAETADVLEAFATKSPTSPEPNQPTVRDFAERMLDDTGVCSRSEFAARLSVVEEDLRLQSLLEARLTISFLEKLLKLDLLDSHAEVREKCLALHKMTVETESSSDPHGSESGSESGSVAPLSDIKKLQTNTRRLRQVVEERFPAHLHNMPSCFDLLHSTLD